MSHTTVRIDDKVYNQLRDYSFKTGVPIAVALTEAANNWLRDVAPARLKALTK